jgi:hypothetical protein
MKTYKRELAAILLVWFTYVVEVKDVNLIEILVWPVFTFVALSFGLDWWGKSSIGVQAPESPNRGRSERSSQRASRENQFPNAGDNEDPRTEDK